MYNIKGKKAVKLDAVTFAELGIQESDIEEILRTSIDILKYFKTKIDAIEIKCGSYAN